MSVTDRVLIDRRQHVSEDILISLYKIETDGNEPTFVTWQSNIETPRNTYWGHYFQDFRSAAMDYLHRTGTLGTMSRLISSREGE